MSASLQQIKDLAEQEVQLLQNEQLDQVVKLAEQRLEKIKSLLAQNTHVDLEVLTQLKEMNAKAMGVAKSLHTAIGQELKRMRKENQRMLGYQRAVKPVLSINRYIDKQG